MKSFNELEEMITDEFETQLEENEMKIEQLKNKIGFFERQFASIFSNNVNLKKDLNQYLKDLPKEEILQMYNLYSTASGKDFKQDYEKLQHKKKDEMIAKTVEVVRDNLNIVLNYITEEQLDFLKTVAKSPKFYIIEDFNFDELCQIIYPLNFLHFIFCKFDGQNIMIHMPKLIKDIVNNGEFKPKKIEEFYSMVVGIINTYGVIKITEAFELVKKEVPIDIVDFKIKLLVEQVVRYTEYVFDPINDCLVNKFLIDENVTEILKMQENEKMQIYDKEFYESMNNYKYIKDLKEYNDFEQFIKTKYMIDVEEIENVVNTFLYNFINYSQLNEEDAKGMIDISGEISEKSIKEKKKEKVVEEIYNKAMEIFNKLPKWKKYGKVN